MKKPTSDTEFETRFFEAVHKRDPQFSDVIEILGGLYTRQGRIADGLKMDRKLVRLEPDNSTAHYNLACSLALSRRKADALRALEQAIALGYRDYDWMQQDPDLEGLKGHPAFQQLLARLQAKSPGGGGDRS
jgi:tetratricopeptide (TPR) repeat protein